jgi:PemK-like, MazF-like toxin of type II toxin-antitoxin system
MAKLIRIGTKLFRQFRALQRERDKFGGKTTKRSAPPTHRVDRGVSVEYSPDKDGDADPGEVVWAWVPFEDDPQRGKDRPVVIIGRSTDRLAGVPLTSKNNGRPENVAVGSGGWDPQGRGSWAKADQLLLLDDDDIRREGAVLPRNRFDDVVTAVGKYHTLTPRQR